MSTVQQSILSPEEVKLLEALRRRERRWPRWRWLLLAIGVGFALSSGFAGYVLWVGLYGLDAGRTAIAVLLISFLCFWQAFLALGNVAMAFKNQPVNSMRRLLLKLADALSERENRDESTPAADK